MGDRQHTPAGTCCGRQCSVPCGESTGGSTSRRCRERGLWLWERFCPIVCAGMESEETKENEKRGGGEERKRKKRKKEMKNSEQKKKKKMKNEKGMENG